MKKNLLLTLFLICIFWTASLAQITLTGTSYTQNFNTVGTALPAGWGVYTGATATALGTASTLTTAQTSWASTGANFRNTASFNGSASADAVATQNANTDRALSVRQTGSFGDPGAAFAAQFASTTGFQGFTASVKLQSLDIGSTRTTTWALQYALGSSPTSFTTITTGTTGNSTFASTTLSGSLPATIDNQAQNLWLRVVALTASTGSGNRATTGIDDFSLTFTPASSSPTLGVSPSAITNLNYTEGAGPSAAQTFIVAGNNLTANVSVTPPTNFEISTDGITYTSTALTLSPASGSVNQTVYSRLKSGLTPNSFTGSVSVSSTGATSQSATLAGTVYASTGTGACGTSTAVSLVRAGTAGTSYTITGRVISNLGANVYIQDASGGILLYTGTGTTAAIPYPLNIGDEVQVTGVYALFNTEVELKNITCFELTTSPNVAPTPKAVTTATLCANQGQLVTLSGVSISSPAGTTFAGNTNYTLSDGTMMRVQSGTDLVGGTRPTGAVNITGVVGIFNGACQLLPRFVADVPGTTINPACTGVGTGGTTIPAANTLDLSWWNVEWFGNTDPTLGPTNDLQQQTNVGLQMQAMQSDVFCLEEVCDISKLDQQIALLNAASGKTYAKQCGSQYYSHWFDIPENPADAKTFAQKVCFVYNTAVITNVSASQILTPPAAGNSDWASGRVPLLMSCDATIMGVTKSLKLVGLHAKAGSDAASYGRRQTDYAALKTYLDTTYPTDNVMIMGDLNDDADQSIYTTGGPNASSFNNFNTATTQYNTISKQLSDCNISSTASFPDIIDHIIVSNEIGPDATTVPSQINYVPNSVKVTRPIIGGTLTSDHFPVTARFTFANSAMPVTWLKFWGLKKNKTIELNWETASEQQNYMFEVEKSSNAKSFERIGSLKGNGTSTQNNQYQFTDEQPFRDISYYRIKQIDFDGTFSYSKTIAVINSDLVEENSNLTIYPNPVKDQFKIQFLDGTTAEEVQIYTVFGQLIEIEKNKQTIDISGLSAAPYLLQIRKNDGQLFRKLIIKQ
jgi:endonuclease/exonuclease/phosphatase family metal-dependent hydrolase